jgi:hypothetical protein
MVMSGVFIIFGVVIGILAIVFGFYFYSKSKGKIIMNVERYSYSPGETVKGDIKLILKEPIQAKSLSVKLVGLFETKSTNFSNGRSNTQSNSQEIFNFQQPLDGQKTYNSEEKTYSFQIKIPSDVIKKPTGVAGAVLDSVSFLAGRTNTIKWYLTASLDISGFDLENTIQLNIA